MGRFWHIALAFPVSPKSGPIRPIGTLKDANQALTHDLPFRSLKRPHWLAAGQALLAAAESGARSDVQRVYELFVAALEAEGWMSFARPAGEARHEPLPPPARAPAVSPSATSRLSAAAVARQLNNVVFIADKRALRNQRRTPAKRPADESGSRTAE